MTVLKRSVQFTILVLMVASFKFGWSYLQSGGIFPISVVKVEADYTHLSQKELEKTISSDLPASFWTVNIRSLQSKLQAIAWVDSVDIQKVWPETLKIRVNEKKPVARWGKNALLSDKEEVFYPDSSEKDFMSVPKHLPILYGPIEQTKNVVQEYNLMQRMLKTKGMAIKVLYMSPSGAWSIRLTNGTLLLLGRDLPVERLKRFLMAYDSIFVNTEDNNGQTRFARKVDLRYSHGLAISWVEPGVESEKVKETKDSNNSSKNK